jgi:site-specific DNA-methyltransferase (adenine-specific)
VASRLLAILNSFGSKGDLSISKLAQEIGIDASRLRYYCEDRKVPLGSDLELICRYLKINAAELKFSLGVIDEEVKKVLPKRIIPLEGVKEKPVQLTMPKVAFQTKLGKLYKEDCIKVLFGMVSESVDLVFADPPFNLDKIYPSKIADNLKEEEYLGWCQKWAEECARVLKPGGSLLIWNLPKWNIEIGHYLSNFLTFRHQIAVDIKYRLPIAGRLYPSHYSLLYFVKGRKPNAFHPDRLPMEVCPDCKRDLRDYGGYKDKMNPLGVSMADVWYDISPVRHAKYKKRKEANELPLKLLDRVIEMASDEGDVIFDPFGGAGTTYIAAELKKRKWIGSEIGPIDSIVDRFESIDEDNKHLVKIRAGYNKLFTNETLEVRKQKGLWTTESVRKNAEVVSLQSLRMKRTTRERVPSVRSAQVL